MSLLHIKIIRIKQQQLMSVRTSNILWIPFRIFTMKTSTAIIKRPFIKMYLKYIPVIIFLLISTTSSLPTPSSTGSTDNETVLSSSSTPIASSPYPDFRVSSRPVDPIQKSPVSSPDFLHDLSASLVFPLIRHTSQAPLLMQFLPFRFSILFSAPLIPIVKHLEPL